MKNIDRINIRPTVSMLSVLPHLNYKAWFALSEFVDNALQSFLVYQDEIKVMDGETSCLTVKIYLDQTDEGSIIIRDNAAGIHEADYARAFRPAAVPPDRGGLSEFGMGMKSAACWFANCWMVRTSALGEEIERTASFDVDSIVQNQLEDVIIASKPAASTQHYTEIVLTHMRKMPHGNTIKKIKEHLASIYRVFLRKGILELFLDDDALTYNNPKILVAPFYKTMSEEPKVWCKEIHFDFGLGLSAHGFAALRETASTSQAGFALFRRDRLIEGSVDETYRPAFIFDRSNSFTYQRLFGELHLEGFEVSHTKDGFQWAENEEEFLFFLKEHLNAVPLPLLLQAEGHRVRQKPQELKPGAEVATERTAEVIKRDVPSVLQEQLEAPPEAPGPLPNLMSATMLSRRIIDIEFSDIQWQITLELSDDPSVGDWVEYSERKPEPGEPFANNNVKQIGIRLALAHPFMQRFGGTGASQIEPLLRIAVAMILAEVVAREGGTKNAGVIRRNVNTLLRTALSEP